jgi:ABC-type transporter Mla maintaining outer membrane lipid asymmetry ATPase subunit MlaF
MQTMSETFSSASPPIVAIERLTRHFDKKTAIDNVSLSIPRGGVFGLIGGNGAGKTTLLRHILGMLKAQTGSVRVFGLDPVANFLDHELDLARLEVRKPWVCNDPVESIDEGDVVF